jgi:DNA invertase Pin-like site-specific DNA recombinase
MNDRSNHSTQYLIYNRKSTDDAENQKNSLAYQRMRNIEFAKHAGLSIATLTIPGFCENGIIDERHSGYKEEADFEISAEGAVQYRVLRPKFLKLVEMLKSKKVGGAIFLCWDRASRNRQDDVLLQKLMRLGCDIRFSEATYDKSSAGDLHMSIDGMFASHYSRVISEKVQNAYAKLHAEGRCTYLTPIGYLDHGSNSKPLDPERAPIVKRIFELYATGEWSFAQLGKWAQQQGLTKKPMRRKRTQEEMLDNFDPSTLPKVARPVDHKTIEYILKNPFYIGKIKTPNGYQNGKFHQPLINTALFNTVQQILKQKNQTVRYVDKPFYTYRGLIRCTCGRSYSPYEQKGIIYYRSRCRAGCDNADPNLEETEITATLQAILDQIAFTDEELAAIESGAKSGLEKVSAQRDRELEDLHAKQRRIAADRGYLAENRITILRTGAMSPQALKSDEERLKVGMEEVSAEIAARATSAQEMLDFTIAFSELVKNQSLYFDHALDSEKRQLTMEVFSELVFKARSLVKYRAKDGFEALLRRNRITGSPVTLISELCAIYPAVRLSMRRVEALALCAIA